MELRLFIEPQQGASYADQLAIARKAEECGFPAFFRSDHLLVMGDGDGLPGPTDTWTTLAGLARDTNTIRLGTLVTSATFRHPGLLAVQVAQVDEMSGGRVELGLGAGWSQRGHGQAPDPGARRALCVGLQPAVRVRPGVGQAVRERPGGGGRGRARPVHPHSE